MSNYTVVDKDKKAEWVINTSEVRLPDYVRHADNPGTDLIILEPGIPTKILISPYLAGQPVLRRIEDPTQTDGIVYKQTTEEVEAAKAPK